MLQGASMDEVLETIRCLKEAHEESRNYIKKHTSHFVRYVGSGSGSADARDNEDSVLEVIETNTDLPASSDDSMTSPDF